MQVFHKCQDKAFYFDLTAVLSCLRLDRNQTAVPAANAHPISAKSVAQIALVLVRLSQTEEIIHAYGDLIHIHQYSPMMF